MLFISDFFGASNLIKKPLLRHALFMRASIAQKFQLTDLEVLVLSTNRLRK